MDKLSTPAPSQLWIVRDGQVTAGRLDARELGLARPEASALRGGDAQHNVDFTSYNKRSAIIAPGATTKLKILFSNKGTIQVVCDVPRHIQLGMVTTFKVL